MPKCTIAQIEREIAQLEGSGPSCAIAYLKAELARRKASAKNTGRPIKYNDEKRVRNRQSAAKHRKGKQAEPDTVIVPFDDV